MKKSIKKILCVLMAVITLISVTVIPTSAANSTEINVSYDDEVMPCFVSISTPTLALVKSGFKATASATLTAQYSTDLIIFMYLQRKESGTYKTIESWEKSGTGVYLSLEKTVSINIFYDYRIYVMFTADRESVAYYAYP